jgi:lipopolysaccharide export system protein LptC
MSSIGHESDRPVDRRWNVAPRQEIAGRNATRRSTRVVLLKYLLFTLSAAMVLTIIIWPQFTERQNGQALDFSDVAKTTPSSTMSNARFVSGGESSVNITAGQVVQDAEFPSIVHMTEIAGDTTTKDGVWVHLSANKGLFDRETERLTLNGDVSLFTDEGNELHSANAVINLAGGEIDGGGPVTGHGPYGRFKATRFVIRDKGNTLLLSGDVRLVIEPSGADQ